LRPVAKDVNRDANRTSSLSFATSYVTVSVFSGSFLNMQDEIPILVEVRRGAIVESRHRGAIVVADPDGHILAGLGDASLVTSTRSTIKPIQAIPFITSGAADHFSVDERELAVVCASHEGEPIHTETVAGMLARAGLDESALRCGAQVPYNQDTAKSLEAEGQPFTQLHNNCSGKHTGMLLTAVFLGLSLDDYTSAEHPVQREIISTFARMAGVDESLPTAIDGCAAPTFGVPLRSLALAFARLVNPTETDTTTIATHRIVTAMINHPEMVGGTKGRFDTELLRASHGKLICKIGAEASYSVGVLPCEQFPRGAGIALKMEDGSYRGLGPAVVETLSQLGVLNEEEVKQLATFHQSSVENRRGDIVGEVRAFFALKL
jgi:L-asparaginase II